jgi:hypothetical protein
MLLREHQTILGRCLQAPGAEVPTASLPGNVQGHTIDPEELAQLRDLVHSSGFRFTRYVQRSWCLGRTAAAARLTLSLLPIDQQQRLVVDWVEAGGGRAFDPASEAADFFEFVAHHLTDPSHALSVCRMEQAAYRASEAALRFSAPDLSLLDDPTARLRAGKGAALVRFFAEPRQLFTAIEAKEPLPPISDRHFPVLFAPGLPKLYRAPSQEEEAIWQKLVRPIPVRALSRDRRSREAIEALFSIAAAELAEASMGAVDTR